MPLQCVIPGANRLIGNLHSRARGNTISRMGNTSGNLRITSFKLPAVLDEQLTDVAQRRGLSRSAVVREALQALLATKVPSFIELAGPLIGSAHGGPPDLSSNPAHMEGFGK